MSDSFATSCTIDHKAPLSFGLSRQGYWSGLPLPPPGGFPDSGLEPASHESPALAGFFTTDPPGSLRWKGRLFIWDFSCLFRQDCIAINFPLRTAFAASYRFQIVMFSLPFVSRYFLFPLWFLQLSIGYLVTLFILHVFAFLKFFPVIYF